MSIIMGVIMAAVLLAAVISEKITGEILVWIWIIGGIIGSVFNYLGQGKCSLKEGVITSVLMYILCIAFFRFITNAVGGGLLKGIFMCGVYFGRYSIVMIVILAFIFGLEGKFKELRKKDQLPGETIVYGAPRLFLAALATMVIINVI